MSYLLVLYDTIVKQKPNNFSVMMSYLLVLDDTIVKQKPNKHVTLFYNVGCFCIKCHIANLQVS